MKKENLLLLTRFPAAFLLFVFTSCAPAYVPNVINSPMFSNKGEFQASGHGGIAGFDPQISYAITDHLGVMMNGSFADRTTDSTSNFHKHRFIEAGAGYYQKIGTIGRFEAFGGGGFGKLNAFQDVGFWVSSAEVNTVRFFLQPAIGLSTDVFDGSIATRLVALNLKQDTLSNTGVLIEPVFTAKVGYRWVKAVFQFGISLPLNRDHIDFTYQPFLFSIGLQATFGEKYE
jgi:opacity protein-like surface antigen